MPGHIRHHVVARGERRQVAHDDDAPVRPQARHRAAGESEIDAIGQSHAVQVQRGARRDVDQLDVFEFLGVVRVAGQG